MSEMKSAPGAAPGDASLQTQPAAGPPVSATAALSATALPAAKAQDVTLKIQAVWSEDSVLHEFAMDYVNIVNTIGAGRVRLEMLPRGAVVSRSGDLQG
ncbi:MAG: hypothetical protein EOO27_31950, partial [Comamonadaceae bacterium]